jgi:dephospho-CoA kinase
MKICVLGYTESGKSTAAKLLADYLGTRYADSSDQLIEELANSLGIAPDHIRQNKASYREQLFTFGRARQKKDPLWPQSVQLRFADIITGLRNPNELEAARKHKLYDIIIWIGRPGVVAGPTDKLQPSDADVVINNDGTVDDLRIKLLGAICGSV